MKKINFSKILFINLSILSILMIIFCTKINAFASDEYRNVDTSQKVYDYADLFTDDEETTLKTTINNYIDTYNYDIFIVTIDHNNISYSSSDTTLSFIEDFGDENGFGIGKEQNYIALIIDLQNRKFSIDIKGYTCMKIYTDSRQEDILDSIYNYALNDDYYGSAKAFLSKVNYYNTDDAGEFIYENGVVVINNVYDFIAYCFKPTLLVVFVAIFLCGNIIFIVYTKTYKNVKVASDASNYIDGNVNITDRHEIYVRSYQTVVKVNSGGSSHGGTSSHSSHGGSSHSGGSRRF